MISPSSTQTAANAAQKRQESTLLGGYQAQPSTTFHTDFTGGNFYTGDFEFVSDGEKCTQLNPIDGPSGVKAADARIVVGDLNGDVAKYVFIISSTLKSGSSVCRINFLESINSKLTFKTDPPFASAAESIFWSTKNVFLPYAADEDGKTILLAATATMDNKLQLQVLRSTGPTLLPPEKPIATGINYNGNITFARASSTTSVDLVSTSNKSVGQAETQLTVIRFFGDTFTTVDDVTQPGVLSSFVTYADLRGVGRVDCLLNTREAATIARRTPWTIPPLRDTLPTATPPAVNALARNTTSSASISASGGTPEVSARTRSQIAYFPLYVVKTLKHALYAAKPDVLDHHEYTYRNARYGFEGREGDEDGRGGGVGDGDDVSAGSSVCGADGGVHGEAREELVPLPLEHQENHSEEGKGTFDVDVSYTHDDFGNIKNITVKNSQPDTQPLVIDAEYENDKANWVLGNKTVEKVNETRKWVGGETSRWSSQTIEFDKAGNDSVITGPSKALLKLAYDETYSNVKTSWTYVTDGADPLVETVDFDLASGKPSKSTEPNGSTTSLVYDVLGRVIQMSIGDKLVEKQTFETDGTHFYQIAYDDFGGGNVQFKTISHLDGLNHVWKTETPRPDREDQMVYSEIEYDGSNRTVARRLKGKGLQTAIEDRLGEAQHQLTYTLALYFAKYHQTSAVIAMACAGGHWRWMRVQKEDVPSLWYLHEVDAKTAPADPIVGILYSDDWNLNDKLRKRWLKRPVHALGEPKSDVALTRMRNEDLLPIIESCTHFKATRPLIPKLDPGHRDGKIPAHPQMEEYRSDGAETDDSDHLALLGDDAGL
ncbi:hypothetical protein HGRIS_013956 [Hohenbuehelia grisea]|uniref:Uncharacterized protein n=1 Tax=Hohenbuehelia grisea TaxID=104357 RepID=A0ABR3JTX4_9AGAR